MGQQESRKRLGGVRTVASTPARFGTRSYTAGPTGGGRLQGVQRPRRPALKPHRIPPIMPPTMPPRPTMPTPPPMPGAPPAPMPTAGVGVQQMAAPPMMRPGRLPSSSVQGVMTGPIGEGSEIQKKLTRYDIIELRQLLADTKRAIRQKESKKKGMGTKDTAGAGSNLPKTQRMARSRPLDQRVLPKTRTTNHARSAWTPLEFTPVGEDERLESRNHPKILCNQEDG